MNELIIERRWVKAALLAQYAVSSRVASRVYGTKRAPEKDPDTGKPPIFPFVTYFVTHTATRRAMRRKLIIIADVTVMAHGTNGYPELQPIADGIDDALEGQRLQTIAIDGTNYTVLASDQIRPLQDDLAVSGVTYYMLGAQYHLELQPA